MPLYEYQCAKCGHEFEHLGNFDDSPSCPRCGAAETEKKISCCARHRSSGGADMPASMPSTGGCGSCSGGNCASCGR